MRIREGKLHQLALKDSEIYQLGTSVSDRMLDIAEKHKQKSLFASVMEVEPNHPDIWNIIATTLFNNLNDTTRTSVYLNKIASLYSIAKCFARTKGFPDPKYCYNYIRCKSLSYHLNNVYVGERAKFFFIDTIHYLARKNSLNFYHKEECLIPYFQLLEKFYTDIRIEDHSKSKLNNLLKREQWVKKMFPQLQKLIITNG